MEKKWISGAIEHEGSLTRQAHAAGQSPMAFAREHEHASGVTGKRARLALTLRKLHHGRSRAVAAVSKRRTARAG